MTVIRGVKPLGCDFTLARWFVGHSLLVEVAVHSPRLAHVEALEASTPQQAPPPSSLSHESPRANFSVLRSRLRDPHDPFRANWPPTQGSTPAYQGGRVGRSPSDSPPSLSNISGARKFSLPFASYLQMSKKYEIRSGRRTVSMQHSSSALQAAVDYVRTFGCSNDEITILGVDTVAWRGARFSAVLVPAEPPPVE